MVDRRAARLVQRSHDLLAKLEQLRADRKGQRREEWLQRARAHAARIVGRHTNDVTPVTPEKHEEAQGTTAGIARTQTVKL